MAEAAQVADESDHAQDAARYALRTSFQRMQAITSSMVRIIKHRQPPGHMLRKPLRVPVTTAHITVDGELYRLIRYSNNETVFCVGKPARKVLVTSVTGWIRYQLTKVLDKQSAPVGIPAPSVRSALDSRYNGSSNAFCSQR